MSSKQLYGDLPKVSDKIREDTFTLLDTMYDPQGKWY